MTESQMLSAAITVCGVLGSAVCGLLIYIFAKQGSNLTRLENAIEGLYGRIVKRSDFDRTVERLDDDIHEVKGDITTLKMQVTELKVAQGTGCHAKCNTSVQ